MINLAKLFLSDNYTVFLYGQEKYFEDSEDIIFKDAIQKKNMILCDDLEECINSSRTIISSVPFSKDKITINASFTEKKIYIEELNKLLKNITFIAGGIPKEFYNNKTIRCIDLLQSEELTILNAIPTVEGTIEIAIRETENTIHECNILVLGYGRIGKILCKRFYALGANIYCTARKDADLAWIREERYMPIKYEEIGKYAEKFDIVINTVPAQVLNEEEIKQLRKDCLIIDVASAPGGVDKTVAKLYKIKVITALGIPGKIASMTAAKYIKEVIKKVL